MKTRISAIFAGLALLLVARAGAIAQVLPEPKLLHTASLAGGELVVAVWGHGIDTRDGLLRCWSYISKGMEKHGQREVVFTVRRTPDLELSGFPEELFDLFKMIYDEAAGGNAVNAYGYTVFRPGQVLLRKTGDWGLMYLTAAPIEGLDLPPNAVQAVLVRDHETALIQRSLHYRVATSMAGAYRYYPYPPWSDPDRPAMVTEESFEKSVLSKVPFRKLNGLTARIALQDYETGELKPRLTDGRGSVGSEIVLSIDPKSLPDIKTALEEIEGKGVVHAWLTDTDPKAGSRFYWNADIGSATVLHPPAGPGSWTTGGFILLGRAGKGLEEKVSVFEDGFAAILSPKSWKELTKALASAEPAVIPGRGDVLSLRIEFSGTQKASGGKASVMTTVSLFNTDEQFEERGFDIDAMAGFLEGIWEAVSAVLDGYPDLGAEGLLVCVAVRPKSRLKVWAEADEDDFDPEALSKIEAELEKLKPPRMRRGTITFSVTGPRWKGEGPPGFPKAWMEVVKNAGKPMTIDDIVAVLWKD